MFPRTYVAIVDDQNRLIDFGLYENEQDVCRAHNSWRAINGGFEWRPAPERRNVYKRPDLRIAIGLFHFKTFHSVSDETLRAEAHGFLHFEIMAAARDYERRSLESWEHRKSYYFKKYRYYLSALVSVGVMTAIITYLRKHYIIDPIAYLSLAMSVIGFAVVGYFLHKEFGSLIGAIAAAIAAWVVWGLALAILVTGTPLYGW